MFIFDTTDITNPSTQSLLLQNTEDHGFITSISANNELVLSFDNFQATTSTTIKSYVKDLTGTPFMIIGTNKTDSYSNNSSISLIGSNLGGFSYGITSPNTIVADTPTTISVINYLTDTNTLIFRTSTSFSVGDFYEIGVNYGYEITGITTNNFIYVTSTNTNNNYANPETITNSLPTIGTTKRNQSTSQVYQSTARRLTSNELQNALPHCMQQRGDFVLQECRAVFGGQHTGYLKDFNGPEREALYHPTKGMVAKDIPTSRVQYQNPVRDDPNKQVTRNFGDPLFNCENKRTVSCTQKGCNCMGQIWRIQVGTTTGLLYYKKFNPNTNKPFEHVNHNASTGSNPLALTTQQKEYIISWAQRKAPNINETRRIVRAMIQSDDIRTTPEQEDDVEAFVIKVKDYVNNSKRSNSDHKSLTFQQQTVDDKTTSVELQQLLDHLMTNNDERKCEYNLDGIGRYLLTDDGDLVQKLIRIHEHDHDGKTWSHITFEYMHANDLATKAVQMWDDGKLMFEMDFFMSVCKGNQWQVGHIGLSDRDHKYWILCVIIAKSENHESAGLLLKRATELMNKAGGDGRGVLVDGGKALDKAVGRENEERVENALEDIRNGSELLLMLDESNITGDENTITSANGQNANPVCDSEVDAICDEIIEAFIGQDNTDNGDVQGRKNLEQRLTKLLHSHKLDLMRCLAHIVRNAGTRGGGWRGGKGSLCRALLNGGCSKKKMQQVRHTHTNANCKTILLVSNSISSTDSRSCIHDGQYSLWRC